jgi:hypothetical protein
MWDPRTSRFWQLLLLFIHRGLIAPRRILSGGTKTRQYLGSDTQQPSGAYTRVDRRKYSRIGWGRQTRSVVVQRKINCSCTWGNHWGYIYNDKIKLIGNQLESSYRHLGNYFRWCGFVPDRHQPHIIDVIYQWWKVAYIIAKPKIHTNRLMTESRVLVYTSNAHHQSCRKLRVGRLFVLKWSLGDVWDWIK